MTTKPYQELRNRYFSPEEQAENDARAGEIVLELTLRELRKCLANLTQAQLAELLDVSQVQISKYEKSDDVLIGNLRRLVEAMGGELRVQARLGKRDWITLKDYSHPESDLSSPDSG